MLTHPLLNQLQQLKLTGMFHALQEQLQMTDLDHLSFEDRFGLLVDREVTERAKRRLQYRLQKAKLHQSACPEDIDYRHPRGLDKALMQHLLSSRWLDEHLNCLITGPTGVGKTWVACALAHQACRQGYTAHYLRLPRLLQDLALARADGRYPRLLREYAKTHLLIIDDWGLTPLTSDGRRDLLEILDDRHNRESTLVTSQLPVAAWHEYLNEPTLADALLDRLVHNAYTLNLSGESMRRRKKPLTNTLTEQ
ncbi:MAG TPA: IS21-like element helper ATPase IstB [Candidatus Competibacteraceae bacterium]|nr:IS21-like element helper ATPase IstB [Candidatus Competibacteraceae bacterium]